MLTGQKSSRFSLSQSAHQTVHQITDKYWGVKSWPWNAFNNTNPNCSSETKHALSLIVLRIYPCRGAKCQKSANSGRSHGIGVSLCMLVSVGSLHWSRLNYFNNYCKFVQTFMFLRGGIIMTLVFPQLSIRHHHQVKF